jgi:hypothetical protein
MTAIRERYSASFKARVALETAKQTKTHAELSTRFQVSVSVSEGTTFSVHWRPPQRLRRDPFDRREGSSPFTRLPSVGSVCRVRAKRSADRSSRAIHVTGPGSIERQDFPPGLFRRRCRTF